MLTQEQDKQLNMLIEAINTAKDTLASRSQSSVLPSKLKKDIATLGQEIDEFVSKNKNLWEKKLDKVHIEHVLDELNRIKEISNDTVFLTATVELGAEAQAQKSEFVRPIGKDICRIGTAVKERVIDMFTSKDGDFTLDPITVIRKGAGHFFDALKTVVNGCIGAGVGMFQGMRKGYVENDGFFPAAGGMLKGGVAGFIKGGFKGAADAAEMLNKHEKAKRKIREMREDNGQEFKTLSDKKSDDPAIKARLEVLKEENKLLAELETRLSASKDPKVGSEVLRSLHLLSIASAGASVVHTGLEIIHDFSKKQKFGGLEGKKALEKLSTDVLNATKNYNAVLDNPSISSLNKVSITLRAFGSAVAKGLGGLLSGAKEGLTQDGFGSTLKGAIYGAFSGASAGAKQSIEDNSFRLSAPSNTQTSIPVLQATQTRLHSSEDNLQEGLVIGPAFKK